MFVHRNFSGRKSHTSKSQYFTLDSAIAMTYREDLRKNRSKLINIDLLIREFKPLNNRAQNNIEKIGYYLLDQLLRVKNYNIALIAYGTNIPTTVLLNIRHCHGEISREVFLKLLGLYLIVYYDSDGFFAKKQMLYAYKQHRKFYG